jgi:hypothetical protein
MTVSEIETLLALLEGTGNCKTGWVSIRFPRIVPACGRSAAQRKAGQSFGSHPCPMPGRPGVIADRTSPVALRNRRCCG